METCIEVMFWDANTERFSRSVAICRDVDAALRKIAIDEGCELDEIEYDEGVKQVRVPFDERMKPLYELRVRNFYE